MSVPLLDEFCRAQTLRPEFLRRCQRELRDAIVPQLDERDRLLVENAALKAERARLIQDLSTYKADADARAKRPKSESKTGAPDARLSA